MVGLSRDMIIHPGITLMEVLSDRGISSEDLSIKIERSMDEVNNVLNGTENISLSFAKKLEEALAIDSAFWINLQNEYDKEMELYSSRY